MRFQINQSTGSGGVSVISNPRKVRSAGESAVRHAMSRSESKTSKYPINKQTQVNRRKFLHMLGGLINFYGGKSVNRGVAEFLNIQVF
jgi:hypothetical protein